MSEFVPRDGIKGKAYGGEEEESNLEISECYTFPVSVGTLDFSARIRINPGESYDPDFIHAGAFVHIQVINLSLAK